MTFHEDVMRAAVFSEGDKQVKPGKVVTATSKLTKKYSLALPVLSAASDIAHVINTTYSDKWVQGHLQDSIERYVSAVQECSVRLLQLCVEFTSNSICATHSADTSDKAQAQTLLTRSAEMVAGLMTALGGMQIATACMSGTASLNALHRFLHAALKLRQSHLQSFKCSSDLDAFAESAPQAGQAALQDDTVTEIKAYGEIGAMYNELLEMKEALNLTADKLGGPGPGNGHTGCISVQGSMSLQAALDICKLDHKAVHFAALCMILYERVRTCPQ
jgi:hypothetical protein